MKKILTLSFLMTLFFIKAQTPNIYGITSYGPVVVNSTTATPSNVTWRSTFVIDNLGNKWIGFNGVAPTATTSNVNSYQLIRYNGTQWDTFPAFNALSSTNKVHALAVDATNNLWIGSNMGLTKYDGSIFTTYNTNSSGIASDTIISLACNGGNVYVGTNNKGLSVFNGSNFTNYTTANGLESNFISCIAVENPTNIWLGNKEGLQKFDGSNFTFYNVVPSTTVAVACIYIDSLNNKWLGTLGKGVVKFDGINFYTMQQLFSNVVYEDLVGGGHLPINVSSICKGFHGGAAFCSPTEALYGKVASGCTHEIVNNQMYVYSLAGGLQSSITYTLPITQGGLVLQHDVGSNKIFYININIGGNISVLSSYDYAFDNALPLMSSNSNTKFLDINNINALINPNSQIHWDASSSESKYFTSKDKMQSPLYNSAFWIGGYVNGTDLRVAAMTYRQNGYDFWPGPLNPLDSAKIDPATMEAYNRVWKINRFDVANFQYNWAAGNVQNGSYVPPADFMNWPGNSPYTGQMLAPYFDKNNDGSYNWTHGDYPLIKGDQMVWWVFNDNYNKHTETGSLHNMGIEVQASAYAYTCPTIADSNKVLNNTTFYDYKVFNRSGNDLTQAYMDIWVDSDLGYYNDDYVGCDVMNNFGYTYNGDSYDEDAFGMIGYHSNLPVFACNILSGPVADANDGVDNNHNCQVDEPGEQCLMSNFTYYNNNSNAMNGNPYTALAYYNLMRGNWETGAPMTYGALGLNAVNSNNPACKYLYPGTSDPYGFGLGGNCSNPVPTPTAYPNWTEYTAGNALGDRRFQVGVGPFTLPAGGSTELNYAFVFTQDSLGCTADSTQTLCLLNSAQKENQRVKRWYDNNSFSSCLDLSQVGIHKLKNQAISFNVYPNPTTDNLYVDLVSPQQNVTIEVYDMLGNIIGGYQYAQLDNYATVPVSNIASGVYFIKVKTNSGITTQKFVKE